MSPKKLFPSNIYQNARKSLHSALPESLPGREKEAKFLQEFITENVKTKTPASMYISGPPGTGKTATLSSVIKDCKLGRSVKIVYINCTEVKNANAIYGNIIDELEIEHPKNAQKRKSTIEEFLTETKKMLILVLDEIDQLSSKNQTVLYTIFEWPKLPKSKLLLIGIANALDLTERILPRLQARQEFVFIFTIL